jgi:hypothetical protein
VRKAARGHVFRCFTSTQSEVIILEKQQVNSNDKNWSKSQCLPSPHWILGYYALSTLVENRIILDLAMRKIKLSSRCSSFPLQILSRFFFNRSRIPDENSHTAPTIHLNLLYYPRSLHH